MWVLTKFLNLNDVAINVSLHPKSCFSWYQGVTDRMAENQQRREEFRQRRQKSLGSIERVGVAVSNWMGSQNQGRYWRYSTSYSLDLRLAVGVLCNLLDFRVRQDGTSVSEAVLPVRQSQTAKFLFRIAKNFGSFVTTAIYIHL